MVTLKLKLTKTKIKYYVDTGYLQENEQDRGY